MDIKIKVEAVLKSEKLQREKKFEKINNFYKEKESKGLVKKESYNLPLTDTIGRCISMYRK